MKDLERVAQFYNEYQVINFGDEEDELFKGKRSENIKVVK